jgi:hypothetical protein
MPYRLFVPDVTQARAGPGKGIDALTLLAAAGSNKAVFLHFREARGSKAAP